MRRNSQIHISKSDYKFLGPYEIVKCLKNGRYDIKKIGTNIVTKPMNRLDCLELGRYNGRHVTWQL